jgi:hypothetical protein
MTSPFRNVYGLILSNYTQPLPSGAECLLAYLWVRWVLANGIVL